MDKPNISLTSSLIRLEELNRVKKFLEPMVLNTIGYNDSFHEEETMFSLENIQLEIEQIYNYLRKNVFLENLYDRRYPEYLKFLKQV